MVRRRSKKSGPPTEGGSSKRGPPKERGSPIQVVPPPTRRRESPRRSGPSVQEHSDDRLSPTSPQPSNEKEIVNMQISPNDQSLDSQVNNEPAVNDPKEKLHPPTATNEEPPVNDISLDSQANNEPPPVYDPEEKLHSSPALTSKTSMADSSGHPNDGGKKAAGGANSSSSDESSSSDDSEDGTGSAPTRSRGKDLAFQTRFGQGKQLLSALPTAHEESSEDSSIDRKDDGARSATTTPARGKDLAFQSRLMKAKQMRRELPTAKNRSTNSNARDYAQCVYFDVFSNYSRHTLPSAVEFDEIMAAVMSVKTNLTSQRSGSTNRMSQLNSEVSSWNTKRQIFPSSSTIFNESIGEDGLSSQSTYDVNFNNPHHFESIAPNPKVLCNSLPSNENMLGSYEILVKAVNDIRIQASSSNTLSAIDRNGRSLNTNIAEMHAKMVCLSIDDVEFVEWSVQNKFARLWYCQDLRHSEILKLSIENAIKKSPHDLVERGLFQDETDGQCNQFVGFVSSHTTGKIVDSFHLHSFAVFHTINEKCTIVTCIVTARNHMLSNMQDRVLQLMQLIQYRNYDVFNFHH